MEPLSGGIHAGGQPNMSGQMVSGGHVTGGGEVPAGGEPDTAGQTAIDLQSCDVSYPDHTIGLKVCRPGVSEGYTLFHPIGGVDTYLIDELGRVVHRWPGEFRPGLAVELLPDGRLVRTQNLGRMSIQAGGASGGIEIVDWDGTPVWSYRYNDEKKRSHHDFEVLPNGNILLISWVA